ncbi:MAG TPA: YbaK/EbsC family protein [Anaerolineales bacterium]|nr:YbaK/EbsC family protein [Anaerolineales bacterium]
MRPPTNPTAIAFQETIKQLDLSGRVVEFDQTTRTAADAAAAIGCEVGAIVKSIIFQTSDSRQAVVVYTSGSNRVSEPLVESLVGEKLGKADADFVRSTTGFAIGGVPPFGYSKLAHTYIDESLLGYETVWAAAGTPNAVFPLAPADLQRLTGATVIKVTEEQT